MSSPCPNGHQSNDPEWCDTCGAPLAGGTGAASVASASASAASAGTASSAPSTPASTATIACSSCGDINPESNLFCETCGLDFVTGQKPAEQAPVATTAATPAAAVPAPEPIDPGEDLGWSATLTVDADWFAAKGEGIGTPPTRSPNVVEMRHHSMVIGRTRSSGHSPGLVVDDDHGISRKHAELSFDVDAGAWSATDLGSTNGTFVVEEGEALNAELTPIEPNVPRMLLPTDRLFVGAWTRINSSN
jgi:FHA domain